MGGKHNKTERRYRQKVQVAQADLRDSVPALRVLYGTSNPEQLATTDIKHADGSVDGLPEVSRPNASAKATILNGARMYIELLQERVAGLQRKVDELETYRLAVGGERDLAQWRADFNQRESARQTEIRRMRAEQEHDDDDDDDEEDEPPKKRKAPPPRKKAKTEPDAGSAVRVFAAFAMSFSLVPSASTLLSHHPNTDITPGRVLSGSATPTQIIARLPLITAEHVHALLVRTAPWMSAAVPAPGTMVDWVWRLLVGAVLLLVLGPIVQGYFGGGLGNVWSMAKEYAGRKEEADEEYAASVAGRGEHTRDNVLISHETRSASARASGSQTGQEGLSARAPRAPAAGAGGGCQSVWSAIGRGCLA
jgi:Sec-independent protein translocase protein TatA